MTEKKSEKPKWSSLKAAFGLNRRNKEYGPFFIPRPRDNDHGDVGYPPGFEFSTANEKLTTALETVQQIQSNLKEIVYGNDLTEEVAKGCMLAINTIEQINNQIVEFGRKLKNHEVNESDVKNFVRDVNNLTAKCAYHLKSCEHNAYMQAGVRGLADVLQITRRSIPDTILVYSFAQEKSALETQRDNLVKEFIIPHYGSSLEEEAKSIIENSRTRPSTPEGP